jgi:hypothetical protein
MGKTAIPTLTLPFFLWTCALALVAVTASATAQPSPSGPSLNVFPWLTLAQADSAAGRGGAAPSDEQAKAAELAQKLQNPIANLISVPMQNNWDFGIGPTDAMRYYVNVQPVIPFSLTTDWNLITRTILPVIYAESPLPGGDNTAGLGDIVQSFFFSPKAPTSGGWIWGEGARQQPDQNLR